jgi:HK97 family phage prohead protease
MKAKMTNDKMTIVGYVNVPGRESKPLSTRMRGKVIEVIEQRAFQRAIDAAKKISLLLDHKPARELADTRAGTLKLYEDEVGLRAEATITDEETITAAREGKIKGWSFNMKQIKDEIEQRAEGLLPIRRIKGFAMDEVSLIKDLSPCYSSMSVEVRAGEEVEIEIRATEIDFSFYDENGSSRVHLEGADAKNILKDKEVNESIHAALRNRIERTRIPA